MAKKQVAESEAAPITKTEAVRQAIAAGKDQPTEGVTYIKEKFGLEVTTQQFSTYKSGMKAKNEKGGQKTRAAGNGRSGARQGTGLVAGLDMVDAASAVKELCGQIGADNVKRLVGLFE